MSALPFLVHSAVAWACPEPVPPSALAQTAQVARERFAKMDGPGFAQAADKLAGLLPCAAAVLAPSVAAEVHVVGALAAFLREDEGATIAGFQAAYAAHPDTSLEGWLSEMHPIRFEARLATRLASATPTQVAMVGDHTLWRDGRAAETVVPSQPAVLQQVDRDIAQRTLLWQPGTPLPDWLRETEPRMSPRAKRRLWLSGGTLVAAAGTTTALLVASNAQDRHNDPLTPYAELDELERTANLASLGGIGAGVLATGLGVTTVVLW